MGIQYTSTVAHIALDKGAGFCLSTPTGLWTPPAPKLKGKSLSWAFLLYLHSCHTAALSKHSNSWLFIFHPTCGLTDFLLAMLFSPTLHIFQLPLPMWLQARYLTSVLWFNSPTHLCLAFTVSTLEASWRQRYLPFWSLLHTHTRSNTWQNRRLLNRHAETLMTYTSLFCAFSPMLCFACQCHILCIHILLYL